MGTVIYKNAKVVVNSVDLSVYVKSATVNYGAVMQDDTTMGMGTKSNKPGLLEWSATVEFLQNYTAGTVDATLFPLVAASSPFPLLIQPVSGSSISFSGAAVLATYNPAGGTVGDLERASATFQSAGTLGRA